ncbi:MAG: histidine phosphatase family protein, partial [Bdellovibrionales bacterium]|nr:histidine phosphatase family protein [Bdellovibrionales bacterium]
ALPSTAMLVEHTAHPPDPLQDSNLTLKYSMPSRLVFLRHGESEANIINRAIKKGIISEYPEGFAEKPDREIRLSRRGRDQALATGPWLAAQYPEGFDVIYVSDHIRAQETAALVCQAAGWNDTLIRIDPQLGERNWGRFALADLELRNEIMELRKRDPLHVPMPDGETLLETRSRARILLDRAARQFAGQRVLVFSHGEYIEAVWAEIAHMPTEEQLEFFHSDAGDIKNCQIVEFGSDGPSQATYDGKLRWVRSSCPQAEIFGDWAQILPKLFTPAQLLETVDKYPNLEFPEI